MRKASFNFKMIKDDTTFYGISLGYDHCSEHEWGIEGIRSRMGMDSSKMGLGCRVVSKGDQVTFLHEGNQAFLTSYVSLYTKIKNPQLVIADLLPHDLKHASVDGEKMMTAWDKENFCVWVCGKDNISLLEDLHEQFKKNNVAIASIAPLIPAFENSSLSILIADRLPKEAVDAMYNVDKKSHDLVEYEAKIGMTELKEKTRGDYHKPKWYMACSAKWIDYEDAKSREEIKAEVKTEYDIQYWINYSDDDDNYGWYTVEEIKKWLSTPDLRLVEIRGKKTTTKQ